MLLALQYKTLGLFCSRNYHIPVIYFSCIMYRVFILNMIIFKNYFIKLFYKLF